MRVACLFTEGEWAIASLITEIQGLGVAVNPAGPGQHVPIVNRKTREIKERYRAIIVTIPWKIPAMLRAYLVCYVVSRPNLVPHRGDLINVSPRESLLGVKADYKRDARCSFGDNCECIQPVLDNRTGQCAIKPRTHRVVPCYLWVQARYVFSHKIQTKLLRATHSPCCRPGMGHHQDERARCS